MDGNFTFALPDFVQWYREQGFSVMPLRAGSKEPAESWKQRQQECAGDELFQSWTQDYPGCNWGIVTGSISGVVVLDIDSEEAHTAVQAKGIPNTPCVKTPKGWHYYFRHPGGDVACNVGLLPGVDVRGDGGYVVAPPSVLGDGRKYQWGGTSIQSELADLPKWFFELRREKSSKAGGTSFEAVRIEDVVKSVPHDPHEAASQIFANAIRALAASREGKRNDQLNKAAFTLGTVVATGELDAKVILKVLSGVALGIGLTEGEIPGTIRSGFSKGLRNPAWQATTSYPLLSVDDLAQLPAPTWLIDGVLPRGVFALLYGDPGIGKSFLALDWAACVASGTAWGDKAVSQGPAVYIYAEGATGLKGRMGAWQAAYGDLRKSNLRFVATAVPISESAATQQLLAGIRAAGIGDPSLIVIDTLARCYGQGDENSARDMGQFVQGVDAIKAQFVGATVLVVHHVPKSNHTRGPRGSSALQAAVDTSMEIRGATAQPKLECTKQKDAADFENLYLKFNTVKLPNGNSSLVIDHAKLGDRYKVDDPEARASAFQNESDKKAYDALAAAGKNGLGWNEWFEVSGLPKTTFGSARKRLRRDKRVIVQQNGRYLIAEQD